MSVLSDSSLRAAIATRDEGHLTVEPLSDRAVQPNSIDLTLGPLLWVPRPGQSVRLKTNELPQKHTAINLPLAGPYELKPGASVLGAVTELISMPDDLMGLLTVKSTWARLFLHQPASVVDAGYIGKLTLELTNLGPYVIWLDAGIDIAQLLVFRMTSVAEIPYGSPVLQSRYQHDLFPSPARVKGEWRP